MSLAKEGYKPAIRGKTTVSVGVNEDGNIALDGQTVAGTKKLSLNYANADNSLEDNTKLLQFFVSLAGGTQDSLSNTASVTWEV